MSTDLAQPLTFPKAPVRYFDDPYLDTLAHLLLSDLKSPRPSFADYPKISFPPYAFCNAKIGDLR